MSSIVRIGLVCGALALTACDSTDQTRDTGLDAGPLTDLKAGIWIDPNGCHHWIIDDGLEGYMSQRLDRFGRPVCFPVAEPGIAVWDYDGGEKTADGLF